MTTVDIQYHNGTTWVDLTNYCTMFEVDDQGITAVPKATVNLESARTNLNTFLANPYRLIRIQVNPSSAYPIFFGYVDNAFYKTFTGTITERTKVSLDCFSYAQRLATDYITYDYYKAQSALSPLEDSNAYSYRDMIEAFLTYPDSTRDGSGMSGTGFTVTADAAPTGIDAIIDGSCSWQRQTLFDAIRTTCDHIGYDGYYPCFSNATFTPTVTLAPFDKANAATISDPLIDEPEYESGSLNDVANVIYGWGGIDAGIPSDGDRLTEYAVDKYDPAIWTGSATNGTVTPSDVNNTIFTDTSLRVNGKCVKFLHTGWADLDTLTTTGILNLTNTEYGSVDAQNRISGITFNIRIFGGGEDGITSTKGIGIIFVDGSGNQIGCSLASLTNPASAADFIKEYILIVDLTQEIKPMPIGTSIGKMYYQPGTTTFDKSNIVSMKINVTTTWHTYAPAGDVGFCVDGLIFNGGYQIEPFQPYSETQCPPLKDTTSIAAYGIHPLHLQDATISSFELMQAEKARLLANLKDPNPILTFTKSAPETTQLYPSYVINSAYRIIGIKYKWDSHSKMCKTTYRCVGKLSPTPPIWTTVNELRLFVK